MGARRPVVVGNWKMNGLRATGLSLAQAIARGFREDARLAQVECIVCPAFPYLSQVAQVVADAPVAVGAQNLSAHASGAHTGEVSAAMLRDVGCSWAIVGHSERRSLQGESDEQVADKARAALAAGLGVIACVGETLAEREAGEAERVINRQLKPLFDVLSGQQSPELMIAYEPVWAIGTGRTATPEQAGEVHAAIREMLQVAGLAAQSIRILYGGSVKADNAAALLALPDIDGSLVGGASLDANDFLAIGRAALG
jgi:triosephosphate isomerase